MARLLKPGGFKEGDSTIFLGAGSLWEWVGLERPSMAVLSMEGQTHLLQSSEKKHPLGSLCVRERGEHAWVLSPFQLERLVGAFLLSPLGKSRLSTDTLPSGGAMLKARVRRVGSHLPGKTSLAGRQMLLHQSIRLLGGGLPRQFPKER